MEVVISTNEHIPLASPEIRLSGAERFLDAFHQHLHAQPQATLRLLVADSTPQTTLEVGRKLGTKLDTLDLAPDGQPPTDIPTATLTVSGIVRYLLGNQQLRTDTPTPHSWLDFDDDTWQDIEEDPRFTAARSEVRSLPEKSHQLPLRLAKVALAQLRVYSQRYIRYAARSETAATSQPDQGVA